MTREQVWKRVTEKIRQDFGRLLDVRDVRRVRRVAGDAWAVSVVLAAPSGDLHVADLTVDDAGAIAPALTGDHVIDAVRRAEKASAPARVPDELADFGGDEGAGEDDGGLGDMFSALEAPIEERVAAAIARGDPASLHEARRLLPRLLADQAGRGGTLLTMAAVEVKLGEPELARGYLEASAREFADRFDIDSLERAAALARGLGGASFEGSPVHMMLEQCRARLRPFANIFDSLSFAWLPDNLRAKVEPHVTVRKLAPGEMLVTEGEPSQTIFVVKSGLIGVLLEKPSGGSWLVRCCFPGWLLGESSVLGGADPRCTASLRAERPSEVWTCAGWVIRALMEQDPEFGKRIAETKQLHRIDSFFSMHETMKQLDVQVRDEILACLQRFETFAEDTLLCRAGEIPKVAYLVAKGSIALVQDGKPEAPVAVVEIDSFYGMRDTLHEIAPGVAAVARAGTTVALFEGACLRRFCERSPEHVVAVLERLG